MKRQIVSITSAFLIVVIAMSVITPIRASANPGIVTISGKVTYQPRNWNPGSNNMRSGNELVIGLYEKDRYGSYTLLGGATINTSYDGTFAFPPIENYWTPDNSPLNVVLRVVTAYPNTANPKTSVTDFINGQYVFENNPTLLQSNANGPVTIDFPITQLWQGYQAIWIFEDLRNTWNYVHNNDYRNGSPYDPGNVKAVWQSGVDCYPFQITGFNIICNGQSWTYGGPIVPHFIFISNANNTFTMDTVLHETAHMFMVNANEYWYTGCPQHFINTMSNVNCAWAEGWADFLPLPVNNDTCYNYTPNPCQGTGDSDYWNLETHSRADNNNNMSWGDSTEGRVAATLYDFYDGNIEGFDWIFTGFSPIADIALGSSQITTFHNFWNTWNSNVPNSFLSEITMWWNTIDYVYISPAYLPIVKK